MAIGDNIEIRKDLKGLFYVNLYFRPAMEEMFENACHVARFEAEQDADALKARMIARFMDRAEKHHGMVDIIDRRYWQGPTSQAACVRWDAEVAVFVVPATKF